MPQASQYILLILIVAGLTSKLHHVFKIYFNFELREAGGRIWWEKLASHFTLLCRRSVALPSIRVKQLS